MPMLVWEVHPFVERIASVPLPLLFSETKANYDSYCTKNVKIKQKQKNNNKKQEPNLVKLLILEVLYTFNEVGGEKVEIPSTSQ